MMIDKIKSIAQSLDTRKSSLSKQTNTLVNDNIQISDAAKLKSSEAKIEAMIRSTASFILSQPEDKERAEKILDLRSKIRNGSYDFQSNEILRSTAENFLSNFQVNLD
jgi:anti-sigma28 factor (negative regulator of flagellin synthesis)